MSNKDKIFLFGASGHAKVVADIVERESRYTIAFLVDDAESLAGAEVFGYRVIGGRNALLARRAEVSGCIVAIGANRPRADIASWLEKGGFAFVRSIHPSAVIARSASIDAGSVVMAGAVVNADAAVGRHCVVNTCASVDHDCSVGHGAHVSPGARLCGSVVIGAGALVGAGAVIVPGRRIGVGATVAAGAVVVGDVLDGAKVAGNPARALS